jgi:hypothetical protein
VQSERGEREDLDGAVQEQAASGPVTPGPEPLADHLGVVTGDDRCHPQGSAHDGLLEGVPRENALGEDPRQARMKRAAHRDLAGLQMSIRSTSSRVSGPARRSKGRSTTLFDRLKAAASVAAGTVTMVDTSHLE